MSVAEDRKALVFAGLSLLVLVGGSVASLLLPPDDQALGVLAAVGAYVFCGRCALSRWHADDRVFSHPSRAASFRSLDVRGCGETVRGESEHGHAERTGPSSHG